MALDPRVQSAVEGDRAAAHSLLSELLPRIRNLARALLGADSEVDDVAQQVMIETMKSLSGYRGEGSLKAWSDRITVRVAISHARRRRALNVDTLEPSVQDQLAVSDRAEYYARRDAIALLDHLPVEQRSAVVMHHIAGFSVPEIAEQENVPQETIRSRLRLAMGKLREHATRGKLAS